MKQDHNQSSSIWRASTVSVSQFIDDQFTSLGSRQGCRQLQPGYSQLLWGGYTSQKMCNSLSLAWHMWRLSLSYHLGRLTRLGSSLYHPFHARCRCPVGVGWSHCLLFTQSCWRLWLCWWTEWCVPKSHIVKPTLCQHFTLLGLVRYRSVSISQIIRDTIPTQPKCTLCRVCVLLIQQELSCLIWLQVVGNQQLTRSCLSIAWYQIL